MKSNYSVYQDNFFDELFVDNFAGGGGASTGIELATGRPVDIAINHDPDAIAMHKVNHPFTTHYQEDVFKINPLEVTGGKPVGILWASPDCKHFSKAKGGKPVDKKIRGLSWVILRWALKVKPRILFMENVEEIQTWCPLIEIDGKMRPDPMRIGETFNGFVAMLSVGIAKTHPAFLEACEFLEIKPESEDGNKLSFGLGYDVDFNTLKACDYGTPTKRKRFYLIARCDREPIVWPKPSHGVGKGLKPYRAAAECIDWSIPCPSIFERKKELAENTQRRIAKGLEKFVLKNPSPFIMEMNFQNTAQDPSKPLTTVTTAGHHYIINPSLVQVNHSGDFRGQDITEIMPTITAKHGFGAVMPSILQYHSETSKSEVRGQKVDEPILTIDGSPRYGINACYISKYFSGKNQAGASMEEPLPTVTGIDHNAVVAVHLTSRHGDGADGRGAEITAPVPTITATCHESLVESHLCVLRNNMDCKSLEEPLPTLTTSPGHMAQIKVYLQKVNDVQDLKNWSKIRKLLNTFTSYRIKDDEILIIEINGIQYFISDIGMRMLKAFELMLAQGFPVDYIIDIEKYIGKKYSEAKQIARMGNAVCPPVAMALVRANLPLLAYKKTLESMKQLDVAMSSR